MKKTGFFQEMSFKRDRLNQVREDDDDGGEWIDEGCIPYLSLFPAVVGIGLLGGKCFKVKRDWS